MAPGHSAVALGTKSRSPACGMPHRRGRARQRQPAAAALALETPSSSPPWQLVSHRRAKPGVSSATSTQVCQEPSWLCSGCKTPHHNVHKLVCRVCGRARTQPTPGLAAQRQSAAGKAGPPDKPVPCGKVLARHLRDSGLVLHSVDLRDSSVAKAGGDGDAPQRLEDLTAESLAAAVTALSALGVPSSAVRPFQAALDARLALAKRAEDPVQLMSQVVALRNSTAKRREVLKAEVETLRSELASKSKVLEGLDQDVEALQQRFTQLAAATAGLGASTKRGGESPQALLSLKKALVLTDDELTTPAFLEYRAEAMAAGQLALCPLRWHLLHELRSQGVDELEPPCKRTCLTGAASDGMAE